MKRMGAAAGLLVAWTLVLSAGTKREADAQPILEARDISGGCCQTHFDTTYLRVFEDGKAEWDAFDEAKNAFVTHQGTLTKKKLKAIEWAIESMKGLKELYAGKTAENNIDSVYDFDITGRRKGRTYHMDIAFGLPVEEDNYSKLPAPVRTVACNIAVTRGEMAREKMDLELCRKYYVGW